MKGGKDTMKEIKRKVGRPKKVVTESVVPKVDKSKVLFDRLSFVLSQTAIDLDMTVGETDNAIMKLIDDSLENA